MAETQSLKQFEGQARLPKFAVPKRYDIFLKPDLDACKFTGTVKITVDVVEDTRYLVLNAAELTVHNKSVWFQAHSYSQVVTLVRRTFPFSRGKKARKFVWVIHFFFLYLRFSQKLYPSEITVVEKDEILVLLFGEVLPHGQGYLRIYFDGTLNDRMKGFYRRCFIVSFGLNYTFAKCSYFLYIIFFSFPIVLTSIMVRIRTWR